MTDKYQKNPFQVNTLLVRGFNKENTPIMSVETGEFVLQAVSNKAPWKDTEKFIKLYIAGISILPILKSGSIKVLFYIMSHLEPKRDSIYLDLADLVAFCKLNNQSIYKGINDLIKNKVIARSKSPGMYWLNPNMFFNGVRNKIMKYEVGARADAAIRTFSKNKPEIVTKLAREETMVSDFICEDVSKSKSIGFLGSDEPLQNSIES